MNSLKDGQSLEIKCIKREDALQLGKRKRTHEELCLTIAAKYKDGFHRVSSLHVW